MERNKNFFSLQMIVEGGIMLALAYVLNMFKLYTMPQGGDISLSMLPIMIFAIRWGGIQGFILGILYGILKLIVDPYVIHPAQLILDYPLPSAFVGLSGISFLKDKKEFRGYLPMIVIAYALKFVAHYLSGLIFFPEYAPKGMSPAYYSFIYNITYLGPELLLFIIVIAVLWNPLKNVLVKQK
ncbi:energy-coupled thiamine transporter ThiT [Helcococcus kunzii]|uniref:energy-coupled thiamine transporter ThiT n=1 Tax=Helcococcus kunzii TaxID=40091 RepID=UPI0024AD2F15|nr:energy-coupled thiamine transporter ThiT [Helcococcus kunzii]